jgi:multiple sugar transport system permease protein
MKKIRPVKVIINTFLSILAVIWLSPIFFAVMNGFKSKIEYNRGGVWLWPKVNSLLENFQYTQLSFGFFTSMASSFLYSLVGATCSVLFATLAAYAIAHLPIKGRMGWFLWIYSGTIFPFQMYLIPVFRMYNVFGLYNTRLGMMLFYMSICIPFALFVIRNFFTGISREILESAKIDGASNMTVLRKILIPMSVAPLAVTFFTQFTWCWGDLMFGLTFTKSVSIRPVMATLSLIGINNIPALFLACIIASVPTLALFTLLQRNMETGLVYQSK